MVDVTILSFSWLPSRLVNLVTVVICLLMTRECKRHFVMFSVVSVLIYRITVLENFRFLILLHTWHHQPGALVEQEGEGKDLQEGIRRRLNQVRLADHKTNFIVLTCRNISEDFPKALRTTAFDPSPQFFHSKSLSAGPPRIKTFIAPDKWNTIGANKRIIYVTSFMASSADRSLPSKLKHNVRRW